MMWGEVTRVLREWEKITKYKVLTDRVCPSSINGEVHRTCIPRRGIHVFRKRTEVLLKGESVQEHLAGWKNILTNTVYFTSTENKHMYVCLVHNAISNLITL